MPSTNFSNTANTLLLILSSFLLSFSGCGIWSSGKSQFPSNAQLADAARNQGNCKKAIPLYRNHLQLRLAAKSRREAENPWFYLIMIGDCYLDLHQEKLALESYEEARQKKVFPELVSDRFIRLADFMTKKNRHEEAIQLLKKHRDLDELLFDGRIDEIHRAMVADEESPLSESKPLFNQPTS